MDHPLPHYDPTKTYRWNYEHAPDPIEVDVPAMPGDWTFCGRKVGSPLGIAAGPLLNGKWCLYYAGLGFDVLTYKTVRSGPRECYPLPNLQPVACRQLKGNEQRIAPTDQMQGTWAVSFGMPSSDPEIWRRDVQWTRDNLSPEKLLCVSCVGTIGEGWSMQQLADDYAICARWAVESGADCVEINFSCPNVATCDGQLYQDPDDSRLVAETVRSAIGQTPLVIKIGYVNSTEAVSALLASIAKSADALAMTNSIATTIGHNDEELMFDGQKRGICGKATHDASVDQVRRFAEVIERENYDMRLIGVGGVDRAVEVHNYLRAGAEACHLATAPMIDPEVAIKIRKQWT